MSDATSSGVGLAREQQVPLLTTGNRHPRDLPQVLTIHCRQRLAGREDDRVGLAFWRPDQDDPDP